MVGALRWPMRPLMPIEVGRPSVNARAGSWQVLQATVMSADKRPSKNSFSPSAIFSGVCGLSRGIAARAALVGRPICCRDLGRANGPASGIGEGVGAVCSVAPRGAAAGSDLAFLSAVSQSRSSPAAPATVRVTHHRFERLNNINPSIAAFWLMLMLPLSSAQANLRRYPGHLLHGSDDHRKILVALGGRFTGVLGR